ncbi:acyltransferase [Bradyrhizobium sp. CB3481]|uniref:acyltransferase family protein n=1 Tax=Bradyrhizobium sp. CB3481 TaxID=3039158 RepID=UPI0024B0FB54|nr:acyltransferase [Bradyrhizobium sp. CB3481]WFU18783.1 acyltransferase [Bradyrhizobium sp. CB3481]
MAELDGLRGIAVILVVLFHFGLFAPGWIGVQLFFVLSGYLISDILLSEKEKPFPSYLGRFYWRRTLRIFPLYFFYLLAMTGLFACTGWPEALKADWPYLLTYTTNFGRLRPSDIGEPFTHLWSLAVEEQFYLLWPLVIYFCSLTQLKRIILGVILLSPAIRAILYLTLRGSGYDELLGRTIYVVPFAQFDAFAFGAAIAVWKLQDLRNSGRLIVAVGLVTAALGVAVLLHQHFAYRAAFKGSLGYQMYLLPSGGFVWGYSLLDLLSAAAIIGAIQKIPLLRILRNKVLCHIGVISYGIYVYHVLVLIGLKQFFGSFVEHYGFVFFVAYAGVVCIVAEISFRLIEKPILSLRTFRREAATLASIRQTALTRSASTDQR